MDSISLPLGAGVDLWLALTSKIWLKGYCPCSKPGLQRPCMLLLPFLELLYQFKNTESMMNDLKISHFPTSWVVMLTFCQICQSFLKNIRLTNEDKIIFNLPTVIFLIPIVNPPPTWQMLIISFPIIYLSIYLSIDLPSM